MTTLKLFGLPRTCTNLVTVLIQTNFVVELLTNYPCWKHGPNLYNKLTTEKLKNLDYIVCTKNPYTWLESLNQFQARHKIVQTLDQFVQGKKMMHYPNKNPIEIYNVMNKHWLSMDRVFQIKYEDLVTEKGQDKILNKIKNKWKLKPKLEEFRLIKEHVNPGAKNWDKQPDFTPRKVSYNNKVITYIRRSLDPETMKLCGYKIK